MAIRETKSIRADSVVRKATNTIREVEADRTKTKDRIIVTQAISGTAATTVDLEDGTPLSLTITNVSSDAVDQTISMWMKHRTSGVEIKLLHLVPIPHGSTLVLEKDDLSFDASNYYMQAQLAVTSGTATAHFIWRL